MLEVSEHEVRILLFCSISRMVAPLTPTVEPSWMAEQLVNSTVPKSANGTSEHELPSHSSKSSMIHSALYSQSEPSVTSEKSCVTVSPVVKFSITADPEVVLVAVTVILISSPSEMEMPEKSSA